MTSILVVEDDAALSELLRYNLEVAGYNVTTVDTGEEAEVAVVEQSFKLLVLDWMLPGVSGIELCRRLRAKAQTKAIPILMLTARGEEADRVRGLSTGADDYVVKPFSVVELLARVNALLRRASPDLVADVLSYEDTEIDRTAHRVTRAGRDIRLGPIEYKLMIYLMQNRARVLTRQQLIDGVWGRDGDVDERTVDVHIGRLRKALNLSSEVDPIRTVRGGGYVFGSK
jgi:two-component system, OmpR family, phosphate regulon response regulator PhoB